jgi:hypothetical protein
MFLHPIVLLIFVPTVLCINLYAPHGSSNAGCTLQAGTHASSIYHSYSSSPSTKLNSFPLCDKSYYGKAYTRAHKEGKLSKIKIRVKIYVLEMDDGTNPIVTESQLESQQYKIEKIFQPLASFSFDVHRVKSSFYRLRQAYPFCDKNLIGNLVCNLNCNYSTTGFDGGDCLNEKFMPTCNIEESKDNGKCDLQCNYKKYNYDNGECCNGQTSYETCVDPKSGNLRWYSYSDYRNTFFRNGLNWYNIGIVTMPNCGWCGGITELPLSKWSLTNYGGTIVRDITIGGGDVLSKGDGGMLIHEMGHAFGLGHIYAGVETQDYNHGPPVCHDDDGDQLCIENPNTNKGWNVGDLCPDTIPTPVLFGCTGSNIDEKVQIPPKDCFLKQWNLVQNSSSLYNPMSYNYLQSSCTKNPLYAFTPCQYGRMRCYIDQVYGTWQVNVPKDNVRLPHLPSDMILLPRVTLVPSKDSERGKHENNVPRVLLEFGAPLYLGQQGDNTKPVLVRFHISRLPKFEFGQIIKTDWSKILPGGQYNFTDDEGTLVPGVTYIYSVKCEGVGGLNPRSSDSSIPILIPKSLPPKPAMSPSSSPPPIPSKSPTPSSSSNSSNSSNNNNGNSTINKTMGAGAIVGIVFGSLFGTVLIVVGSVFLLRWIKRRDGDDIVSGFISGSNRGSYIQI